MIDDLHRAGTETQLLLLLSSLDRTKVKPYLCLLNGDSLKSRSLEPQDIDVLRLKVKKISSYTALRGSMVLLNFLRKNDIEFLQLYFPDSTTFAAPVGKLARCQVLGAKRNIGHWMQKRDFFRARVFNYLFIDAIVANCRAAKEAVVKQEGVAAATVFIVPNGIDLHLFEQIRSWQDLQSEGPVLIGAVGNLRTVKGTDLFLKAAYVLHEQYNNVQFVVAGGGDTTRFQAIIDDLCMGAYVSLLGSVEDIPALLGGLDIAVIPSRAEGMSGALLEYMAAGRPIVATRVGGNPELITHEHNGILVEPEDALALAAGVGRFIRDTKFAMTCAARAQHDASGKFSSGVLAEAYTNLLLQLRGEG